MMRLLVLVSLVVGLLGVSVWKSWTFWHRALGPAASGARARVDGEAAGVSRVTRGDRVRVLSQSLTGYCLRGMTQFDGVEWVTTREGGLLAVGEMSAFGMVRAIRRPVVCKPFVLVQCVDAGGRVVYVNAWAREAQDGVRVDRDHVEKGKDLKGVSGAVAAASSALGADAE